MIHDRGLISILKQLHDDLDAAVFDAYNWPQTLTDDQLLEKLVALNHQRAAEEKQGPIKYLRTEFQNPTAPPSHPPRTTDHRQPRQRSCAPQRPLHDFSPAKKISMTSA